MKNKLLRCHVIMLPTQDRTQSQLYIQHKPKNGLLFNARETVSRTPNREPQHLFFCSDREIREGDFYVDRLNKTVRQGCGPGNNSYPKDMRIEASNNAVVDLPCISDFFLGEYATRDGNIKTVDIEMEEYTPDSLAEYPMSYTPTLEPKLFLKTWVIIHKRKEEFTREEMYKAFCAGADFDMSAINCEYYKFTEWFDANY
jgi:hypothetical protein